MLALLLALVLLVPAFTGLMAFATDADSYTVTTDVPQQEIILAEQNYDSITAGDTTAVLGRVKEIVDGGDGYPYGKVVNVDFDNAGHNWSGSTHTYIGGTIYTAGDSRNEYDMLPYVPTATEGWTVTFNFRVVQEYVTTDGNGNETKVGEYLWVCVYDDDATDGTTDGFKIKTTEFEEDVWYSCTVSTDNGVWTATKTALTGSSKGATSTISSIQKESSISGSRYRQFCYTFFPVKSSSDSSAERQLAHYQIDEVKLTAMAYSSDPYTYTVAEQDFEDVSGNTYFAQSYVASKDTLYAGMPEIASGGEDYSDGSVAVIDYTKVDWTTASAVYPGGVLYTHTPKEQLEYVPSPSDGFVFSIDFYRESTYTGGEYLWISVYDSVAGSSGEGFRIPVSQFVSGVWYRLTLITTGVSNSAHTCTATALTGSSDGTVTAGTASSLTGVSYGGMSSGRVNQITITLYDNSATNTSDERKSSKYMLDNIRLTTERLDTITAQISPEATVSGELTPILAAYDSDGLMTAYVTGTLTGTGTSAQFDIKNELDAFRNAASVKTMYLENLATAKPYAAADEVGDDIWGGAQSSEAERATLTVTADMLPLEDSGNYATIVYTVPNTYDASNIPSFEAGGNALLYLGQDTVAPTELVYDASLYNYTAEDIVVVVNNGTTSTVSILEEVTPPKFTNVVIQLGALESELNFTWFSLSDGDGIIKYAKLSELQDGALPEGAATATALRTAGKKLNYYGNKATITGLEPSTVYCYQLINGDYTSEIYAITTGGQDSFSFAFAGDPQIGRGYGSDASKNWDCIEGDGESWGLTLSQMMNADEFAGVSFLMSAGDQTNSYLQDYDGHELQWDAYTNHDELLSMPTVTVLGNHDNEQYSVYPFHVNEPNLLTKEDGSYYGATYEANSRGGYMLSADYYFTYNNVLFLVLNTNTMNDRTGSETDKADDKAAALEHGEFIERVMEETADREFDWTIVLYHFSPYGSSYHGEYTTDENGSFTRNEQYTFANIREFLLPILYENGVDLILSGHDHCYTRTHILKPATDADGNYIDGAIVTPYEDGSYVYADGTSVPTYVEWTDADGNVYTDLKVSSRPVSVTDPDGILHVTGASSSGSQPNRVEYEHPLTAVTSTANTRQLSRLDISENELTIVTYNLGTNSTEDITEIDRFTIIHTEEEPDSGSGSAPNPGIDSTVTTKISGVQLLLEDDLTMRYNVTLASGEDIADYTMRFTMNGKVTTVACSEVYNGKYVFPYSGIAPQMIGDSVKAELLKDGIAVATVDEYSILDNVNYLLENSPSAELEALLADLLNYGAAAQEYTGYKTGTLVNAGLTSTGSTATPAESDDVRASTGSTSDVLYCTAAGVRFDSINKLYVKFKADSLVGVSARFGEAAAEIVSLGGGEYAAYSEGIYANAFGETVTFTLAKDGTAVQTVTYSVNAYAYAKYDGDSTMSKLALAMYRYGKSAENYDS